MKFNPRVVFDVYTALPAGVRTRLEGAALAYLTVQYGPGTAEFAQALLTCLQAH